MPIRVIACFLAIIVLIVYSWRRSWFIGACGAMIMMAFVEHPEMPRTLLGIPGLSPWNLLIVNVTFAWIRQRPYEGDPWDMPRFASRILRLFLGVMFVAFLRLLLNPTAYIDLNIAGIINEAFVNSLKFMLPMFLFFDGCRTPERTRAALLSLLIMYSALGLMIVKHMGVYAGGVGGDLNGRGAKFVHSSTGYHRVDMAMMLAGASWGAVACIGLATSKKFKVVILVTFLMLTLAEALTGGRTGYITWCLIGLVLCLFRWRRLLLLLPFAVAAILSFMPAVADRVFTGFGGKSGAIVSRSDQNQITSDRTEVWPFAISAISESPWIGYGRYAFRRIGLSNKVLDRIGEDINHPHNAYLEMLLDNGVIGSVLLLPVYAVFLFISLKLFMDRSNQLNSCAGGLSLTLLLALMIASIGAQTLYPREGVAGMWAAAGIMLRRYINRQYGQEDVLTEVNAEVFEETPATVNA